MYQKKDQEIARTDPDIQSLCQRKEQLTALQDHLRYHFKDNAKLEAALTHPSIGDEQLTRSFLRLRFLGSAAIDLGIISLVYDRWKEFDQGKLTNIISSIRTNPELSQIACEIGLDKLLRVGKGINEKSPLSPKMLGDSLKVLIGAIRWDQSDGDRKDAAVLCVSRLFSKRIQSQTVQRNYSNDLKSLCRMYNLQIFKVDANRAGGRDDAPVFSAITKVGEEIIGRGSGNTVKKAKERSLIAAIKYIEDKYQTSE